MHEQFSRDTISAPLPILTKKKKSKTRKNHLIAPGGNQRKQGGGRKERLQAGVKRADTSSECSSSENSFSHLLLPLGWSYFTKIEILCFQFTSAEGWLKKKNWVARGFLFISLSLYR